MSKLNLNTKDGLKRLMNEMNSVLEKRIKTVELNESIDNVDNISFLECKQIFESISDKLYETKEGQKIIANYIRTIKSNAPLRALYTLSENIKTLSNGEKKFISNPSMFVTESINMVRELDQKKLQEGIDRLRSEIKKAIKEAKITSTDVDNAVLENKTLNESLNYVFMNKKNVANLLEYTNKMNDVVSFVCENSTNEFKGDPILEENKKLSDLKNIFSNDLELWENKVISKLTLYNLSGNDKKPLFEEYKDSCLKLIDEALEDSDITLETKSHLSTMKKQLSDKTFLTESATEDILKLANLENTLKN